MAVCLRRLRGPEAAAVRSLADDLGALLDDLKSVLDRNRRDGRSGLHGLGEGRAHDLGRDHGTSPVMNGHDLDALGKRCEAVAHGAHARGTRGDHFDFAAGQTRAVLFI